jgi:predicted ester cyclase
MEDRQQDLYVAEEEAVSATEARGKKAIVSGMSIIRVTDGQIIEGWNNWDIMGLMQQIGALQPATTLLE